MFGRGGFPAPNSGFHLGRLGGLHILAMVAVAMVAEVGPMGGLRTVRLLVAEGFGLHQ
jgi:hypothetical protein